MHDVVHYCEFYLTLVSHKQGTLRLSWLYPAAEILIHASITHDYLRGCTDNDVINIHT